MKKPHQALPKQQDRKDRLKAALKANMAKRKAQSRARAAMADEGKGAERKE